MHRVCSFQQQNKNLEDQQVYQVMLLSPLYMLATPIPAERHDERVCQPIQIPTAGTYSESKERALPCCLCMALTQPATTHRSRPQRTSRSHLKSFFLIITAEAKQDSLVCVVTMAFTPSGVSDGQYPGTERRSSPHHLNRARNGDLKDIDHSCLDMADCEVEP